MIFEKMRVSPVMLSGDGSSDVLYVAQFLPLLSQMGSHKLDDEARFCFDLLTALFVGKAKM